MVADEVDERAAGRSAGSAGLAWVRRRPRTRSAASAAVRGPPWRRLASAPRRRRLVGALRRPPRLGLASRAGRRRSAVALGGPCGGPTGPPSPIGGWPGPAPGVRSRNTQPRPGTGLPPMRRPSSNSQGYWPWNSWNESFDRIDGVGLVGDLQDEGVAAADGAGGRRDQLAGERPPPRTRRARRGRCGGRRWRRRRR